MMKFIFASILLSAILLQADRQKVTFESKDGLEVTADLYEVNPEYPYVLLLHQAGASRGEYLEIADKISKLRYNCLAVDLRSGNNANYVSNETAQRAREQDKPHGYLDTRQDIKAAIDYAWARNPKEVILMGSSYSASLAMLEGMENAKVKAVIAFSPGEYFTNDFRMQDELSHFSKPLFIAVTRREAPYVTQMMQHIPEDQYTLFQPEEEGIHGVRSLWNENPSKDEYWLAFLLFINNLNN